MGINKYSRELESYFSGELSGADRILFEGRVESDPALKAAFEHQNTIVEGLRAHRVSELKTRLNSISVEPTVIGALMQSSVMKSLTYGVASMMLATGAYLYYNTESAIEYHIENIEGITDYSLDGNLELGFFHSLDYRYNQTVQALEFIEADPVLERKAVVKVEKNGRQIQPLVFDVPEVILNDIAEDVNTSEVEIASLDRMEKVSNVSEVEKVNIQTIHSRKYNFHYRMEDNRLFLYGKFGASPYEIIEVSAPGKKMLFFYYQNEFYQLDKSSSTVTPLSKIMNQELVRELEVLKNKG